MTSAANGEGDWSILPQELMINILQGIFIAL